MAPPTLDGASAADQGGTHLESRSENFTIDVVHGEGCAALVVRGELDIATVPLLQAVLDTVHRRRPRRVEVDLSAVGLLDACAAGCLLDAHRQLATGGTVLVLRNPSRAARQVLALPGLDEILTR